MTAKTIGSCSPNTEVGPITISPDNATLSYDLREERLFKSIYVFAVGDDEWNEFLNGVPGKTERLDTAPLYSPRALFGQVHYAAQAKGTAPLLPAKKFPIHAGAIFINPEPRDTYTVCLLQKGQ